MMEQFMEDCLLRVGPHAGTEESVRSPPPEEEGAAEKKCDELIAAPLPHPPVLLWGRR